MTSVSCIGDADGEVGCYLAFNGGGVLLDVRNAVLYGEGRDAAEGKELAEVNWVGMAGRGVERGELQGERLAEVCAIACGDKWILKERRSGAGV